jgi:coproporphyrinogen III oxidase-like Fe-S oxidoreductase
VTGRESTMNPQALRREDRKATGRIQEAAKAADAARQQRERLQGGGQR